MNIRFVGIDGIGGHEVNRIFSKLTDFDFIKSVGIREFNNPYFELLNIYDVTIEVKPNRDDVYIHIFDNAIYITERNCRHYAMIYIDRSAYAGLEII